MFEQNSMTFNVSNISFKLSYISFRLKQSVVKSKIHTFSIMSPNSQLKYFNFRNFKNLL